ncbi:G patch domain-containing protein 8-like [Planoprotostelium fungivorum]|uniref:G patch domain-containing protein 8-like n=1 Tax=Planoprotostelium fungivorum TaxID=1890364 RepID=A0A2P6NGD9_9EUKA|nr:G patch domain-containing protein 8-like [Planoprotostelium fungivorum]
MATNKNLGYGSGVNNSYVARMSHREQSKREEEDVDTDFSLPITHRITKDLDTNSFQQISMDTPLGSTNKGYQLMLKMGWKKDTGLGSGSRGIVDPVRLSATIGKLGLGKLDQDLSYTENIERPRMLGEVEDTVETVKKREVLVEKQTKLEDELTKIGESFRCDLCSKQYKNSMELQAHFNSYEHGHKHRFKEMQQMNKRNAKPVAKPTVDRELEALMQKANAQNKANVPAIPPPPPPASSSSDVEMTDAAPPPPPPAATSTVKFSMKPVKMTLGGVKKPRL